MSYSEQKAKTVRKQLPTTCEFARSGVTSDHCQFARGLEVGRVPSPASGPLAGPAEDQSSAPIFRRSYLTHDNELRPSLKPFAVDGVPAPHRTSPASLHLGPRRHRKVFPRPKIRCRERISSPRPDGRNPRPSGIDMLHRPIDFSTGCAYSAYY